MQYKYNSVDIESSKHGDRTEVQETEKAYPVAGDTYTTIAGKIPFVATPEVMKKSKFICAAKGIAVSGIFPFGWDGAGLYAKDVCNNEAVILMLVPGEDGAYSKYFFYHATGDDTEDILRCHEAIGQMHIENPDSVRIVIMVNSAAADEVFARCIEILKITAGPGVAYASTYLWTAAWSDFFAVLASIDENTVIGSFGHSPFGLSAGASDSNEFSLIPTPAQGQSGSPSRPDPKPRALRLSVDLFDQYLGMGYPLCITDPGFQYSLDHARAPETPLQIDHRHPVNKAMWKDLINSGVMPDYRTFVSYGIQVYRQLWEDYAQGDLGRLVQLRMHAKAYGYPWIFRAGPYVDTGAEDIIIPIEGKYPVGVWNKIGEAGLTSQFMPLDICSSIPYADREFTEPPIYVCMFLKTGKTYTHCCFTSIEFHAHTLGRYDEPPDGDAVECLIISHKSTEQHLESATEITLEALKRSVRNPKILRWIVDYMHFVFSVTTQKITFGCDFEFWRNQIKAKKKLPSDNDKIVAIYNKIPASQRKLQICGDVLVERTILTKYDGTPKDNRKLNIMSVYKINVSAATVPAAIASFGIQTVAKIPAIETATTSGCRSILYSLDPKKFDQIGILAGRLTEESILFIIIQPDVSYSPRFDDTRIAFDKIFIYHTTMEMLNTPESPYVEYNDVVDDECTIFSCTNVTYKLTSTITRPEISSLLVVKYNPHITGASPDDEKMLLNATAIFNKKLSQRGVIFPERTTLYISADDLFCLSLYCTNARRGARISAGIYGTFGKEAGAPRKKK